ncbi:MAG: SMP-30/gluconolactonase/LRE family protein [Isosphaeraceae bacterium]|nr:SMP-30/gluconolactonase/LRE family protein [Isosphaeraceae bacterium]
MARQLRNLLFGLAASIAFLAAPLGSAKSQILVSDVGSNSVKLYNQNTGAYIRDFIAPGSGGLSVPFGITFGPDQNLYVASLGTGEVLRYNGTTGAFINKFVTKGSGGLAYPNQVLFGPDNNLYVSNFSPNSNGAILQYQGPSGTPGAFIKTFAQNPGLAGPTGMAFSPFGDELYVSSSSNNSIFRFNSQTGAPVDGGAMISGAVSGLNGPAGLSFGPDGNLYVANFFPTGQGQPTGIIRYDLNSPGFTRSSFTGTLDINGPVAPVFAVDTIQQQAFLYVPSHRNNTIYRFNPLTGAFDPSWSLVGGNLINPTYMTVIPGGFAEPVATVPEPTSIALTAIGAGGLIWIRRRRTSI